MTRIQGSSLLFAYLVVAASWGGFAAYRLPAPVDLITALRDGDLVMLAATSPSQDLPNGQDPNRGSPALAASSTVAPAPAPPPEAPRPRGTRAARAEALPSPSGFKAVEDRLSFPLSARDRLEVTPEALDRRRLPSR